MLHSGSALSFQVRGAGSIPVIRSQGFIAQLVRAIPCHGIGRGFKSHWSRMVNEVYTKDGYLCRKHRARFKGSYCMRCYIERRNKELNK